MEREKLGSRLGFILLSAGCAIGCGNVWKFPWMCGQYGGGGFVLLYVLCLVVPFLCIYFSEFICARIEGKPVEETVKGERFSIKMSEKIRPSDRLYKMEKVQIEKELR